MAENDVKRNIFKLFAHILEYPRNSVMDFVLEGESILNDISVEATMQLSEFRDFIKTVSVEQLQEVYTVTFDMNAAYQPYVGYLLFGESYKRSMFLVELKKHYRAIDFVIKDNELPDHIVVMLHFIAACSNEEMIREIACEALLPTLEKMIIRDELINDSEKNNKDNEHGDNELKKLQSSPYEHVLLALKQAILQLFRIEMEVKTYV